MLMLGGKGVIRDYVTVRVSGGTLSIGQNFFINSYSSFTTKCRIEIGENCLIGEGVRIYDHDHAIGPAGGSETHFKTAPVIIGKNVWIGSGVVILRGSTIGDGAVIGAGSLIKGKVPAGAVVYRKRDELNNHVL